VSGGTEIRDALRAHYCPPGNPRKAESYVLVEEARAGAAWAGNAGQCDLIAVGAWQSTGHERIGHEVKVSRSDWLRERADPTKADRFMRYCHRWYLVIPTAKGTTPIVEIDEVPASWGLMAVQGGRLRTFRKAPLLHPEPLPESWWVGWLAQISRGYQRADAAALSRAVQEAHDAGYRRAQQEDAGSRHDERLREAVALWRESTGIDVTAISRRTAAQLAAVWPIVESYRSRLPDGNEYRQRFAQLRATLDQHEAALLDVIAAFTPAGYTPDGIAG
jgi:hypothetical protein